MKKEQKVKTPRDLFVEEEHKKFTAWCRRNDWDFCSLERRAAWVCWLGRAEEDFQKHLASVIDYQI